MKTPTTAPSAITCTPTKTAAMVDAIDEAFTHISKLEALLQNTYSESGPSFRNLRDDIQDSYLWACADLAAAVKTALESSFTDGGKP
jgi:hypothetical protein